MTAPPWQYDEFTGPAVDLRQPFHAATCDGRKSLQEKAHRLVSALCIGVGQTVVEFGVGAGAVSLAAAETGAEVIAIDVSAAALERLEEQARQAGLTTLKPVHAGFLTYAHRGPPVDLVVTRFALHHLPDFWKGVALAHIARMLKPGGRLFLQDVVFSFDPVDHRMAIEHWIEEQAKNGNAPRSAYEAHVRAEHSTFAWVLEALLEKAGFSIIRRELTSPVYARYLCERAQPSA